MNALSNHFKELQLEMGNYLKSFKKEVADQLTGVSVPPPTAPSSFSPSATPSLVHQSPAVKSDHLKLTFPTFGRSSDDSDPLLYLTRCQDFLALHPLDDIDILATFRTVLYGTSLDWWEVAQTSIISWSEFEAAFLSDFSYITKDV